MGGEVEDGWQVDVDIDRPQPVMRLERRAYLCINRLVCLSGQLRTWVGSARQWHVPRFRQGAV
jgi:hypothetical protein